MSQKFTILFDLDGTLVNSAPDLMHAHNHVMKKYGYNERKLSDIRKLAGRGSKVMLTKSIHELAELSGKIKKFGNHYNLRLNVYDVDSRQLADKFDVKSNEGLDEKIILRSAQISMF